VRTRAPQSNQRENIVIVDKGIADVIRKLNSCGFKTISSCSSLMEDHLDLRYCRSSDPYICIADRHAELIDVAEQSGWDWRLDGKTYAEDGKMPLDHVNFYSSGGYVYKSVHTARELRVHRFWHEKRTSSSKEEAIRYRMPIESTTLTLTTNDLSAILSADELVIPDDVIRTKIDALEKALDLLMPKQAKGRS